MVRLLNISVWFVLCPGDCCSCSGWLSYQGPVHYYHHRPKLLCKCRNSAAHMGSFCLRKGPLLCKNRCVFLKKTGFQLRIRAVASLDLTLVLTMPKDPSVRQKKSHERRSPAPGLVNGVRTNTPTLNKPITPSHRRILFRSNFETGFIFKLVFWASQQSVKLP